MINFLRMITPSFLLGWYHFTLSFIGAVIYGFPSRNLIVIGVTGTNGKSTTVEMLSRIFQEAGIKSASISSIRFQIGEEEKRNRYKMTMPGRFAIQKFLKKAKDKGVTHVVLEVTSEGIMQYRHRFINFHTIVFTNLSPEHIERHGSFENYRAEKGKLFKVGRKVHVINLDDKHTDYFLQFPAEKVYGYTTKGTSFDNGELMEAQDIKVSLQGLSFSIKNTQFILSLHGEFNVSNALAAVTTAIVHGVSLKNAKAALLKMESVPGRMEEVVSSPFRVFVDYAFTPAALEKVYLTLRENTQGKLICVLGAAGGGRDKWKRPVLGRIAATHCEKVIITNEDPYGEDPEEIIQQVAGGASGKAVVVIDRRKAIAQALSLASKGDVVIITGKGSEDSIAVARGKKIPWDDREVVREELDTQVKL
ncbi:MAG TPA: UDP-N-acetylmuramoyl-L-alanyl-D-glutamate--2,6-diaminopimelate ligase [Candidatus Wildermuthbacteria bacterium]|nr:UDP-N-acetylmuramoyl-L-alanyl-D-glutamate--2,6-diaminopimelate ligase [Candidatus Wildermuthbacteria bacterium]